MSEKTFAFELYRLNIVDIDRIFSDSHQFMLRTDDHIKKIIKEASNSKYDKEQKTSSTSYKWSIRGHKNLMGNKDREFIVITLARSIIEKDGLVVTEDGIESGRSQGFPPLAAALTIFFDLSRHLVAVEYNSELSSYKTWRTFTQKIFNSSSEKLGFSSSIELEEVTEHHELIKLFNSFDKITRVRVNLRIPNPELSRYTKDLYKDLNNGGIREYLQDMKNPNGLSQDDDARPHASVALAEAGYKQGDIILSGNREGKKETIKAGDSAVKGQISELRDFVRGISANTKTKETARVLKAITNEIDRISPKET